MVLNFIKSGYKKVKETLSKSGSLLGEQLQILLHGQLGESSLEAIEKLFYEADLGMETAAELTKNIRKLHLQNPNMSSAAWMAEIRKELIGILQKNPSTLLQLPPGEAPLVVLVVGVNGNGKTTTVAKLAKRFHDANHKVLIGAADTFRAAATEQLDIWAQRLNVEVIKGTYKSDPSAVVFDTLSAAKARQTDVVLIDTAGRLHTKTNLMQELEKIKRTCKKVHPSSPHEVLLVLDATTGQNAIDQAKTFNQFIPITGLILTKLDGSAKGGIAIAISRKLGIPVKFIGVGEGIEDLEAFDPESFVNTLLG